MRRTLNNKKLNIAILFVVILIAILFNLFNDKESVSLTDTQIDMVNDAIENSNNSYMSYLQTGNSEDVNYLMFFLITYYEKPEEMDLGRFVSYMPKESYLTNEDQNEYDKLSAEFNILDDSVENLPTSIGRVSYERVNEYLDKYMGISINLMSNYNEAIYLDEYSTFYNRTSDVWTSDFVCISGSIDGNIITLNGENEVLTLEKRGEKYYIISFLPIDTNDSH